MKNKIIFLVCAVFLTVACEKEQHTGKESRVSVTVYDENGKGLKSMFLKAPLDYFRISSRFSGRRFHPVQMRFKAHNGTDYAAPHGTPIKTTASGVVERTG